MKRALTLLVLAGCAGAEKGSPIHEAGPLRVEAAGVLGGAAAEGGISPDDLSAAVERLAREGRRGSAERLARKHIDAAWAALAYGRVSAGRSAIAWFHDRHASAQGSASGWTALLSDRLEHPDRYRDYDAARERIARLLREGRAEDATDADAPEVPEDSPAGPVLRVEAARLAGVARLIADRPLEAVEALEPGIAAARAGRPYDLSQLLLLLGEAKRRAGAAEAASAAWSEAVETAAALADRVEEVFDPAFWERAINLKPPGTAWPPGVVGRLAKRAERSLGTSLEGEAAIWACVGERRLSRGEAKSALMAFSKAGDADPLRVARARALAAAGEVHAARAMIAPLAAKADGPAVKGAEALMGALELRVGAVERGLALLRKATEGEADWPGRAQAEANLGLALLGAGQEKDGLRWLRSAQTRYEVARDPEGLSRALRDEARWAESAGRSGEADRARERLSGLEGS